jgi:hypothetical protein
LAANSPNGCQAAQEIQWLENGSEITFRVAQGLNLGSFGNFRNDSPGWTSGPLVGPINRHCRPSRQRPKLGSFWSFRIDGRG